LYHSTLGLRVIKKKKTIADLLAWQMQALTHFWERVDTVFAKGDTVSVKVDMVLTMISQLVDFWVSVKVDMVLTFGREGRCDNRFAFELRVAGLRVSNPCFSVTVA